ncbi:MAG: hypothetical protein HYY18_22505 [Planctomycetes bacterium]|nr:hypothetical protein [Planctomycetota bacterium]
MPQILVRNVSPELLRRLKELAGFNKRSLQAEVQRILEDAVVDDARSFLAKVDTLRARFAGRKFPDSTALIRKARES